MTKDCTCGSDCECCCICNDPDYEPGTIGALARSMKVGEVRDVMGYQVTMMGWFPLDDATAAPSDPPASRTSAGEVHHDEDDEKDD